MSSGIPSDGSGRLQAGPQSCTVRLHVVVGGKDRVLEGKLPIEIAQDGTVSLGPPVSTSLP